MSSPSSRFVQPTTTRLPISNGDWIEIKRLLTVGEQKRINTSGMRHFVENEKVEIRVDMAETSFVRTLTYLVGWSLTKEGPNEERIPVPITRSSVESLTSETYAEIEEAINKHVQEVARAKKTESGVSE